VTSLETTAALHVQPQAAHWVRMEEDRLAASDRWERTSPEPPAEVGLQLTRREPERATSTVLEQAWVQTRLGQRERWDRAVFRFTTSEESLRIQVPPGVRSGDIQAVLMGQRLGRLKTSEAGLIDLALPPGAPDRPLVAEVWYPFLAGRPPRGPMDLALPRIVGASGARQLYWQLVLPADEHLVLSPPGLTPELAWRRTGASWGRRAALSQQDLEAWIGASRQPALPEANHQYLFSAFGDTPVISVRTVGRRELVLAASGAVLVLGLLLLYVPLLRRSGALLLLGVSIFAAALYLPEAALQAAQAGLFGLAAALAACGLEGLVARRRSRRTVLRGRALPTLETRSTQRRALRPENGGPASTNTAGAMAASGE
jgi:hypothetical protein